MSRINTLKSRIETLKREYPIFPGAPEPEIFAQEVALGSLDLIALGLCTQLDGYGELVASSVGVGEALADRAWFELIERATVIRAEKSWDRDVLLPCLSKNGVKNGTLSVETVFPTAPCSVLWAYSKSNGVAAHLDFERASARAFFELVERDRVLRSWYGQHPPEKLSSSWFSPYVRDGISAVSSLFEVKAYRFGEGTVGIFGFPFNPEKPIMMGLAADPVAEPRALERAWTEAVQRQVFLLGEALIQEEPPLEANPGYHLDFYLQKTSASQLRRWLSGEHQKESENRPMVSSVLPNQGPIWVDLTPEHLKGKASVVKAIERDRVPLTFGLGNPLVRFLGDLGSKSLYAVHPIA
jgi:hypothetical protein